ISAAECPASKTATNPAGCHAASLLLHITQQASGYFDNMWLWVADHMLDTSDPSLPQLSVYEARGLLIESQAATWLYGTASEHSVFYQYNFYGARNIFTTMVQTESPYYQPVPKPPAPFASVVGKVVGDPGYDCTDATFGGCDASWATIMEECQSVSIGSAGTYSWFSAYTQDCIDGHSCQSALWRIQGNYNNNWLQNVITIGSKYMLVSDGKGIHGQLGCRWTPRLQISVFDLPSKGAAPPPVVDTCESGTAYASEEPMTDGDVTPISSRYYITIVNLTPYRFVKTSQHSNQIDPFDFGDIPSGRARQNTVVYSSSGNLVDCNGEAYFKLEGTDTTFEVRATTHRHDELPFRTVFELTGMGLGQREYQNPCETSGVTLVITGSEEYGYMSSLTFQPCNWMNELYNVIKDWQFRHIVMPGTHDAGMTTISTDSGWSGGGIKSNTQTQSLSIFDQLRTGSRYFDMRLVSVGSAEFWAAHVGDENSPNPSGATGAKLTDMIGQLNTFMSQYPGELIIWHIRYMRNFQSLSEPGNAAHDPPLWTNETAQRFYNTLATLDNRCLESNGKAPLQLQNIPTFLDQNDKKGCVLLLTDPGSNLPEGVAGYDRALSVYPSSDLNVDDYWAEKDNTIDNSEAQVSHMKGVPRDKSSKDAFYIMQWQCTPNAADGGRYGLDAIALWSSNPALYWDAVNAMSSTSFPTVMMVDYIGQINIIVLTPADVTTFPDKLGAEIQTLAMGLNLYMVSQNCKVSTGPNPIDQAPVRKLARRGGTGRFAGIVYANGTVDNHPPANFHIGRVKTLKAGTVFGNGTVLHKRPQPGLQRADHTGAPGVMHLRWLLDATTPWAG
ncbi:PLC-like phosphodiesterase, partial [Staphylotrichum tortipilum]